MKVIVILADGMRPDSIPGIANAERIISESSYAADALGRESGKSRAIEATDTPSEIIKTTAQQRVTIDCLQRKVLVRPNFVVRTISSIPAADVFLSLSIVDNPTAKRSNAR